MTRYVVVSIAAGVLFAILDALIHGVPVARELYAVYRPVARESIDVTTAVLIDLGYGFVLAALFHLLRGSLPGDTSLLRGLSFGAMVWFLRVVMNVAAEWVTTTVPASALLYRLGTGLVQALVLGAFLGRFLKSPTEDLASPPGS